MRVRVRVRPGTATVACTVPTACTFSRGLRSAFGFDKAEVEAGGGKPGKGDAEGGKSGKVRRTPLHPPSSPFQPLQPPPPRLGLGPGLGCAQCIRGRSLQRG